MKILFVTQGYAPAIGGTENLVQNLAERLVQSYQDEVTVFTTNCYGGDAFHLPEAPVIPVESEDINGVHVRRFPVRRTLSKWFYYPQQLAFKLDLPFNQHLRLNYQGPLMKGLKKAILSYPADLIVAASFPLKHMFVSVDAAHQSRRPVALIGAMHPLDLWGFGRPMIIRAIQSSDAYIALSTYERDYLVEKGIAAEKIDVIGVGIDPERVSALGKSQAKEALGLTGQKVVGFIGQIAHHKGVGCLVDAMKIVWRHFPDVTLLIAGARRFFASEIEAEIASWPEEWQKRVLIKYDFDEKEKPFLFNAVDVFVYPSGFESFGIAYLEAWSARKPVIGTWEGAIPSVVDAGTDGLLVNYLHRDELAEAIMTLLSHPAYAQKLGNSGYQKVLQKYTWPQVTAKYREVFSSLID